MDRLQIEKLGGQGNFGGPHLKGLGELALSDLSPEDRQALEALFGDPQKAAAQANPNERDAFRYRITRQTVTGPQSIEVPHNVVPQALKDSVKDRLE